MIYQRLISEFIKKGIATASPFFIAHRIVALLNKNGKNLYKTVKPYVIIGVNLHFMVRLIKGVIYKGILNNEVDY